MVAILQLNFGISNMDISNAMDMRKWIKIQNSFSLNILTSVSQTIRYLKFFLCTIEFEKTRFDIIYMCRLVALSQG